MSDQAGAGKTPTTNQSGGITVDAQEVSVTGDVTGRDKVDIHVGSGATVIVGEHAARHPLKRRSVLRMIAGLAFVGLLIGAVLLLVKRSPEALPMPGPPPPLAMVLLPLANCPATLSDEFYGAVTSLLATESITISVRHGTTPVDSAAEAAHVGQSEAAQVLVLWGHCPDEQATYHAEILLPPDEVAEPAAVEVTWPQHSTLLPAKILAAIVAYYSGAVEVAAAGLLQAQPEWTALDAVERANLHLVLGNALLQHRVPSFAQALEQYTAAQAAAASADGDQSNIQAWVHNNRGLAYFSSTEPNYEQAEQEFSEALNLKRDFTWARLNRGLVYMEMSRFVEAHQDCQEALRQSGNFAPGYLCEAKVYYREAANNKSLYAQAYTAAERAIQLDTQNAEGYYYAGTSACGRGDASLARRQMEKALALAQDEKLRTNIRDWLTALQVSGVCE